MNELQSLVPISPSPTQPVNFALKNHVLHCQQRDSLLELEREREHEQQERRARTNAKEQEHSQRHCKRKRVDPFSFNAVSLLLVSKKHTDQSHWVIPKKKLYKKPDSTTEPEQEETSCHSNYFHLLFHLLLHLLFSTFSSRPTGYTRDFLKLVPKSLFKRTLLPSFSLSSELSHLWLLSDHLHSVLVTKSTQQRQIIFSSLPWQQID